ncbi:MAG: hypothetical protein HON47_05340 [Candidatus Diapherotrites archaeon]|jgi:hypothetical protein|uniref:Uncharacterized protein n=1 Tax=Candidatus Iainarchaeum sp. TaxID=3101447 RepID=A0A8T5GGG0_9ARCH|nr:hypothetical protein [Candidatus Diapherotrites archaeon]
MQNNDIDKFVEAISESFDCMGSTISHFWPLNGGQIGAYFDAAEALDIYYRLKDLRRTKSLQEIAELMPPPDVIKSFLQVNGVVGLKVAKNFKIEKISTEEIVDNTLFLLKILETKLNGDFLGLGGTNLLLDTAEIENVLSGNKWVVPKNGDEKRQIANLVVTSTHLCYSLFYDIFQTAGFYIHGPYDVSKKFGEDAILVIREHPNINPKNIWSELEMPYSNLIIYCVYKGLDFKLDFSNHPYSNRSIADKLISYGVLLDGKELPLEKVLELEKFFEKSIAVQTKKVDALSDFDKVRKGAKIAFSFFEKLRRSMGDDDSKLLAQVDENIKKFGDKFIQQFGEKQVRSNDYWKKLFDPRNDYL